MTDNRERSTFLLTGVNSGIGLATAQLMLESGYTLIGFGNKAQADVSLPGIDYIEADFADVPALEQKIRALMKSDKAHGLAGLIACAGYGRFGALEEFSAQQMSHLMNVNFLAHAVLIKYLLPQLKSNKKGIIVGVGSESAVDGGKYGSVYCASKFALRGLFQSLRQECSSANIGFSLINPGMVRSPFFDSLSFEPGPQPDNFIEPRDVAEMILAILEMRSHTVIDEVNMSPMKKVVRKK